MKILFVCNEYPPANHGGIGTFTKHLAEKLAAAGCSVQVVGFDSSVNHSTHSDENGVKVFRLHVPRRIIPSIKFNRFRLDPYFILDRLHLSKQISKIIREDPPDIVESYDWSGPLWLKPAAPLVVRLHGANTAHRYYERQKPSRILKFLEGRNIDLADRLVAVSDHIGQTTLAAFDRRQASYTVIYNGVDTSLFRPLPVEKEPFEILYVGRLHPRKGINNLLQAIPLVINKFPQARFTFVGPVPDEQWYSKAKDQYFSRLSPRALGQIQFLGYQPQSELPKFYSRCAVAIFPSHAEAFGLTCVEAMACGAAVIMTSLASGPEIVDDGFSGCLVDPGDPQNLANAITNLLSQVELRNFLGKNARNTVIERFDLNRTTHENLSFYCEVISE